MPAEWEPHEATWLSWPNFCSISYPLGIEGVYEELLEIIRILALGELVYLNVAFEGEREWILNRVDSHTASQIRFQDIPTCEPWNRDLGPTFLVNREAGQRLGVDWGFNGWGGRFHSNWVDSASKTRMAQAVGADSIAAPLVIEGGSVETDGDGTLLCVATSVANAFRNPDLSREEIDNFLRHYTGTEKVLWLEEGLQEDETDGHIDTLGRFVAPGRIVLVTDSLDPLFGPKILRRNRKRLEASMDARGRPIEVIDLPPAQPFTCLDRVTPVTHANFYVANTHVLVPEFGVSGDEEARELLAGLFPTREAVLVSCRNIAVGLGGVHCLTQQLPAI